MDPFDTSPVSGAKLSPRPTYPGAWFDQQAAANAVNFFRWYCRFSAGPVAGRPFVLEPWQVWIISQLFGWKMPDGRRLYTRVMLWVPRGNGKTELLSGVALLSLVALGLHGGETYTIAATEEQARKMFKGAQDMRAMSPDLAPLLEPLKRSLYCGRTHSVYIPLTARPTGKHGLRCSVLLGDEMHEWPDSDLYYFVQQSMIKWREPIEFLISTAGKPEGYGHELWDECQMICDGMIDNPHTLAIIYAAEPEKDDLNDPAVWARVNPNIGVSIDRDVFARDIKSKMATPSGLATVKRYNFNIWSGEDVQRAIQPETWAQNTSQPRDKNYWRALEDELAGQDCFGGLDVSAGGDLNALVWLFPPAGERTRWAMLPRFWWPRVRVDEMRRRSRIRVEEWEASGAMFVTSGNASDHLAIERQIYVDMGKFQVRNLALDAWNSHQLGINLAESGVPLERVRDGLMSIGPVWKRVEKMLMDGDFEHGSHPVLGWNAACLALRAPDDNGNTKPTKAKSTGKIDGITAALLAGAVAFAEPMSRSYLETHDLMVLN